MAKPFDATLNALLDLRANDWAAFLAARAGIPPGPATAIDTDLSVTAQADKVFRIDGPTPALVHLEMESSGHLGMPADLMWYNTLLSHAVGLPVHSVLMLLRRKANASDQTGEHRQYGPAGLIHVFHYTVVRVWEERIDDLLAGGVGLTPLAILTDEAETDLAAALSRVRRELQASAVPDKVSEELLLATYTLGGLRYSDARLTDLYRSLNMILEDSTTYQWLMSQRDEIGRRVEARSLLLRMGRKKFGDDPTAESRLKAVPDIERLERIADRMFDATSWDDLLNTP